MYSNVFKIYELSSARHSATFETKSSYCRVARQRLPCYTAVARLGFNPPPTPLLLTRPISALFSACAFVSKPFARPKKTPALQASSFKPTTALVATLLRHCFEWLQHCPGIATLCGAKNRRCESSRVTSF